MTLNRFIFICKLDSWPKLAVMMQNISLSAYCKYIDDDAVHDANVDGDDHYHYDDDDDDDK